MSLRGDFKDFCKSIQLDNRSDMESTTGRIAKKLNEYYYDLSDNSTSHMYIVGSVGRRTAIKGSCDLDILFDLPSSVYYRFDQYSENGQSALIQEVKSVVQEIYPKTDIRGDGQVVVINFNKYTVELVPGFRTNKGSFIYPDTHDGGSWKTTDPLPERDECSSANQKSRGIFYDFCHILRAWKNNIGLSMNGLLIDTLVYDHFKDNSFYSNKGYDDYLSILINVFAYLKDQQPDREFWYAVGSNQKVYNTDKSAFASKAKSAYNKLNGATNDTKGINKNLIDILGTNFPAAEEDRAVFSYRNDRYYGIRGASTEQFIEELFPVDIRYGLKIDCRVTQDGFRPQLLSDILRLHKWLSRKKQLDFQIVWDNCPKPLSAYSIYWKVRNVGEEAIRRNMIRGEIKLTNNTHQKEHTDFYGPHYVECFLVQDGVCVARARIDVPIE